MPLQRGVRVHHGGVIAARNQQHQLRTKPKPPRQPRKPRAGVNHHHVKLLAQWLQRRQQFLP
jgi:hypothetical protein